MRLKLLLYLLFGLMFYGCVNHSNSRKNKQFESYTIVKTIVKPSPFAPIIAKGIEEAIGYIETEKWEFKSEPIYTLSFVRKKGCEFVDISAHPLFIKERIVGYTYLKNRIITYNGDTIIGNKYVNVNKLELYCDTIPEFIDLNDRVPPIYEPYGILYQIIGPDSLSMVHKGTL